MPTTEQMQALMTTLQLTSTNEKDYSFAEIYAPLKF